ncbi:MAG: hypothetical protein KatS3mg124_2097 [Porticoccaceae bacterium]|nr:MAG: hypothetical protein KatS3mg124_2097 [Porticoccaceae bacterium]
MLEPPDRLVKRLCKGFPEGTRNGHPLATPPSQWIFRLGAWRDPSPQPLLAIHQLDVALFTWVRRGAERLCWLEAARLISRSADGPGYLLLALFAWLSAGQAGDRCALWLVATFALERPLYFALKQSIRRSRPTEALPGTAAHVVPGDRFSLPSGHTSAAFAVATTLALCFPVLAPWIWGWSVAVGAARVVLGVHFPSDVVVGAAVGTAASLAVGGWVGAT